jgi:hypothetical protein
MRSTKNSLQTKREGKMLKNVMRKVFAFFVTIFGIYFLMIALSGCTVIIMDLQQWSIIELPFLAVGYVFFFIGGCKVIGKGKMLWKKYGSCIVPE